MVFNVEKEKLAIPMNLVIFFQNLPIRNMSMHISGAQKRKERKNRDDNERRG